MVIGVRCCECGNSLDGFDIDATRAAVIAVCCCEHGSGVDGFNADTGQSPR